MWEFFQSLLNELDEKEFRRQAKLFIAHLKSHGQKTLLEYVESYLFPEHKMRQWAKWYRQKMYDCEWIANDNMFVESWHRYLKTLIMERKTNIRVDTLLRALIKSEVFYYWKWCREHVGFTPRHHDPRWLIMFPVVKTAGSTARYELDYRRPPPSSNGVKQGSLATKTLIKFGQVTQCFTVDNIQRLAPHSQRLILQHLSSLHNVFQSETQMQFPTSNFVKTTNTNGVIPRVVDQYPESKFNKKRKRNYQNVFNIKPFKSPLVRSSCVNSFLMAHGEPPSTTNVADVKSMKLILSITRSRSNMLTLGGITFFPVVGGFTVKMPDDQLVSLNVRVGHVERDSVAHKSRVHVQMYLKSMALADPVTKRVHEPLMMGQCSSLSQRTESEQEGDIWRGKDAPPKTSLQLDLIMNRVDDVVTSAMLNEKHVQVELVQYNM